MKAYPIFFAVTPNVDILTDRKLPKKLTKYNASPLASIANNESLHPIIFLIVMSSLLMF